MPLYAGNRGRVKEEERVSSTALRDDCHKYLPDVCDIFRPKKIEFLAFRRQERLLRGVFGGGAERGCSAIRHSEAI